MLKDAKYLIAYLIPFLVYLGITWGGKWVFATPLFIFGLLPLAECFLDTSAENIPEAEEQGRSAIIFFDLVLYGNVLVIFELLYLFFQKINLGNLANYEYVGLVFSMSILLGTGINVAHELGHRVKKFEQLLGQLLLMPSFYMHFFIEHNLGHHKYVATLEDAATARFGESLFTFWLRSVSGVYKKAWEIETYRLEKKGYTFYSFQNHMLIFQCCQMLWLAGIAYFFSITAMFFGLLIGVGGFLLLESINYIEHYGLLRAKLASGRYEPVGPQHSWNSDHKLGRIFLYELTRHSDHHYKSTRKYQILRHLEESPQLPYGYPGSILLALFPSIWFRVMNPLVRESKNEDYAPSST